MKTLARGAFGVVFAALTTLVTMSPANAVCSVQIYANSANSNGSYTYIYGTTGPVATFSYYARTTNSMIASLVFAAAAQRNRVFIAGNVASCPTTGTLRYLGVILSASMSP